MKLRLSYSPFLFLFLISLCNETKPVAAPQDTLVINSVSYYMNQSNDPLAQFFKALYATIADSLEMIPQFTSYPILRAELMLKTNEIDIEIARVFEFGVKVPEALRITEPIISGDLIMVYLLDSTTTISSWNAIPAEFTVDYIRGIRLIQDNLSEREHHGKIYPQNTLNQCFERLLLGRTDIVITFDQLFMNWKEFNSERSSAIHCAGAIDTIDIYSYLSPEKAYLRERIEQVLRNLKTDGYVDSLEMNLLPH